MIASVVARIASNYVIEEVARQLANREELEIGAPIDNRMLPIVIECGDHLAIEEITRWLESQVSVERVDVVYVNWEQTASESNQDTSWNKL